MTTLDAIAHSENELRSCLRTFGFPDVRAAWLAIGFEGDLNARIAFDSRGEPRVIGFDTREIQLERAERIIEDLTNLHVVRRRRLGPRRITDYGSAP